MTRISLVEAYDDKDVITQIAKIKDKLDSIPDDADLSNCVLKVNNQIIDGRKTFKDVIVANDGISVTGDLNVDGNIVQSGVAVEVHVEEIYTKNDYIVMRDEAVTAIPPGDFSGLQVKKYDGTNDCRLVVDDQGMARVGDVGDEHPLATRDEAADMVSGAYVRWDGVNLKMIAPDVDTGDDTHPVKFVDGAPVAVVNALQTELTDGTVAVDATCSYRQYGKVVTVTVDGRSVTGDEYILGVPKSLAYVAGLLIFTDESVAGHMQIASGETQIKLKPTATGTVYGSITYITE